MIYAKFILRFQVKITEIYVSALFPVQAFGPKACRILHEGWALRYAWNDAGCKCQVSAYLFIWLFVYLFIFLFVYLSICLFVNLSFPPSVYLSLRETCTFYQRNVDQSNILRFPYFSFSVIYIFFKCCK